MCHFKREESESDGEIVSSVMQRFYISYSEQEAEMNAILQGDGKRARKCSEVRGSGDAVNVIVVCGCGVKFLIVGTILCRFIRVCNVMNLVKSSQSRP